MKKFKKGFTIVELVIVIAVIGILSAVLIPTFSNLIGEANEAKVQAEVSNAYLAYQAENVTEDDYVAQENVYLSKAATAEAAAAADVYHYVAGDDAAWVKATGNNTYVLVDAHEYNGYYIYKLA